MNWLLILIAVSRPALEPVGEAEVALANWLEAQAASAVPAAFCFGPDAEPVPGRFLVGYEPGGEETAADWIKAQGGAVVRSVREGRFLVASFPDGVDATRLVRAAPELRYVEPDLRVHASHTPNDPFFLQHQWGKWVMYADKAWDIATGSNDITVAVIDNGVDYTHPDLADRFVPGELGYDYIGDDNDPAPDNPMLPEAFHGTHVAGIIAATMDNGQGVAGWAGVRLYALRVLNDSGSGDQSAVTQGVYWAAYKGVDVINMSMGSTGATTALIDACQFAVERDVLLIAAAGNESMSVISYPAALDDCVCVGATDEYSGLASFSNTGPQQELVAPGTTIASTAPNGAYVLADGTSMASPQVAGVAALVRSFVPSASATRVRSYLGASAVDMGAPGRDQLYGYGIVNAVRALELARLVAGDGPDRAAVAAAATITRGALQMPDWAERAEVYDGLGRLVSVLGPESGRTVQLLPGTYFVRSSAGARTGQSRVLVLR